MNSSLALVIYGNAYLQGQKIDELEADTPLLWFKKLKTKNMQCDLWESSLRAIRQSDDSKIWQTTCYRLARGWERKDATQIDLSETIDQMEDALADIMNFCISTAPDSGATMFLENFQNAQRSLRGDIVPAFTDFPTLSSLARQLMVSAIHSSVFGAMGSWNDLGDLGKAKEEYDRVSAKLYSAINTAFIASANSSFLDSL